MAAALFIDGPAHGRETVYDHAPPRVTVPVEHGEGFWRAVYRLSGVTPAETYLYVFDRIL